MEVIKQWIICIIICSIVTAVLSIKGILSNIADTVAVKGTKLLVSSVVPIIGGSVSDAYASVVNSLLLLRSSVGIFGIVAIAVILAFRVIWWISRIIWARLRSFLEIFFWAGFFLLLK
jgi:stage III sporulation protein AE